MDPTGVCSLLRRISNIELFSAKRLGALQYLRRDQVFRTIQQVLQESMQGKSVNIWDTMVHSIVNLLGNLTFGKDMFDPQSPSFRDFKDSIWQLSMKAGAPNLADYFPFLRWLDLQGVAHHTTFYLGRELGILDKFIDGRFATKYKTMDEIHGLEDLLDALLDMSIYWTLCWTW